MLKPEKMKIKVLPGDSLEQCAVLFEVAESSEVLFHLTTSAWRLWRSKSMNKGARSFSFIES